MKRQLAELLLATSLVSGGMNIPSRKGEGLPESGNYLRKHKTNVKRRHKRRIEGNSRSLNHKNSN